MQTYNQVLQKCNRKSNDQIRKVIESIRRNPVGNSSKTIALYERVLSERNNIESHDCRECDNEPFDVVVSRKHLQLYKSAMSRGKEFNLTYSDVKRLLLRKKCAYTGVELTKSDGDTVRQTDRTIDRIDSTKGYVRGNVVAVSHAANQMKEMILEGQHSTIRHSFSELKRFVAALDKIGYGN